MHVNRKRPLDDCIVQSAVKFPRLDDYRKDSAVTNGSSAYRPFGSPFNQSDAARSTEASDFNIQSTIANVTSTSKYSYGLQHQPATTTATYCNRPFTYQPLEQYRRAEALRLLFIKHGLHYKQPQSNISLFDESNLTPFMEQWEDCLSHWSAIMGSDAKSNSPRAQQDAVSRSFHQPGLQCHRDGKDGEETLRIFSVSASPPGAQNDPGYARFEAPELFSETYRPSFKPAMAQRAESLYSPKQVRQMVKLEVQRQLDTINARATNLDPADPLSCVEDFASAPAPMANEAFSQPSTSPLLTTKLADTPTEIPELVPVHQLLDGTIEYLDEGAPKANGRMKKSSEAWTFRSAEL